jgi:RND family efflux transporter MFP subunit
VNAKPCYVSVDASESDLLAVRRRLQSQRDTIEPGQVEPGKWRPVELALGDEPDFHVKGHIDYVNPQLNADTGTIRVRSRFENEDEFLLPGLYARLRFPMETNDSMLVPDIALPSDQAGRYALVVNEKGVVEVRRVTTGLVEGSLRVVLTGLTPADRVVVEGIQRARPGQAVTAKVQAAQPAPAAPPAAKPAAGASRDQK